MEFNTVTLVFCVFMGVLFAIDFATSFSARHHRDCRSIIVTVGVLGTFVGVFIGLQGFNTADIGASVPLLLEGMKTAFLTSIVGMGLSVLLSIGMRLRTGASDEPELLSQISAKLDALPMLAQETRVLRDAQEQSLASMNTALDKVSEGATQEIVAALETVVSDFNSNLTAQFGDNFGELNQGVAALLQWQENYRDILSRDAVLMQQVQDSLDSSAQTLGAVAERNSETQAVYDGLAEIITASHNQLALLQTQTTEYARLSESATAAFAQLDSAFANLQGGLQAQSDSVARLTRELERQVPQSLGHLENTLTGLTSRFAEDYRQFLNRYRQLVAED